MSMSEVQLKSNVSELRKDFKNLQSFQLAGPARWQLFGPHP